MPVGLPEGEPWDDSERTEFPEPPTRLQGRMHESKKGTPNFGKPPSRHKLSFHFIFYVIFHLILHGGVVLYNQIQD